MPILASVFAVLATAATTNSLEPLDVLYAVVGFLAGYALALVSYGIKRGGGGGR